MFENFRGSWCPDVPIFNSYLPVFNPIALLSKCSSKTPRPLHLNLLDLTTGVVQLDQYDKNSTTIKITLIQNAHLQISV